MPSHGHSEIIADVGLGGFGRRWPTLAGRLPTFDGREGSVVAVAWVMRQKPMRSGFWRAKHRRTEEGASRRKTAGKLHLGPEKCGGIWSIFGHFSPIFPRSFHKRPKYTPAVFPHADTLLSYNPLTTVRAEGVATPGLSDVDCQLTAQSSTCDYVFPAWEKRVCAWSVNVF